MPEIDWPTTPVVIAPPPPPAADPEPVAEEPQPEPVVTTNCPDPDCVTCRVARVGARTIARMVGVEYDELPAEAADHYTAIAAQVFGDMSEALIEHRAVILTDEEGDRG